MMRPVSRSSLSGLSFSLAALLVHAIFLLAIIAGVTAQQHNNGPSTAKTTQHTSVAPTNSTGNTTNTTQTSGNLTVSSNTTLASSPNATSTTNSTLQSTFPVASYPTQSALAGTGQAPFPDVGSGHKDGNAKALGPDDSYIAAAGILQPKVSLLLASVSMVACTILLLFTPYLSAMT